jgi:alkylation response protein AidB-like acyl-CoA dehydrogenase
MSRVTSLNDESFATLCRTLSTHAGEIDAKETWPAAQLSLLGNAGVFEWFVPQPLGGQGWSEAEVLRGYIHLAQACLTTAFIVTQRQAAVSRIVASPNEPLRDRLLPDLLTQEAFATVGISHLTTSRRHLARPALRAEMQSGGFVLEGMSPWITGAGHADTIVVGATLDDGRQLLAAVPAKAPGVRIAPYQKLVALSGSHTGPVFFDRVFISDALVLAGPVPEVMKQVAGARTGGLQTSALAMGLARAAIDFLQDETQRRTDLEAATNNLQEEFFTLQSELLALASGTCNITSEEVRSRANSLVLRATQAALAAAKGAGFVAGHPTGRWCREALFFLVWSCPQAVVNANLCEFAGLD